MAGTIKLPIPVELRLFHGLRPFLLFDILCALFILYSRSQTEFSAKKLRCMLKQLARSVPDVFSDERLQHLQEELDMLEFISALRRRRGAPADHYVISPKILVRGSLMHDRGLLPQHEAALRSMAVRLWDEHHV